MLDRSDAADGQRRQDLERVRLFAERLAQHRSAMAQFEASECSLSSQLAQGARRIDEDTIAKFGQLIVERLEGENRNLRKVYVKLLIDNVEVDNDAIRITGSKAALEAAITHGGRAGTPVVPIFDREWCRLQDSNL